MIHNIAIKIVDSLSKYGSAQKKRPLDSAHATVLPLRVFRDFKLYCFSLFWVPSFVEFFQYFIVFMIFSNKCCQNVATYTTMT